MIAALIFDFDGLIVDTESPAFESWRVIYAEYGFELPLALWQGALGTNHGFDSLAHLIDLAEAADPALGAALRRSPEAVFERRQALKSELSMGQPLLPGVLAVLRRAAELGMPCAVASSSYRGWVEGWLERHAIRPLFRCVRTADDVERTKPDPALFLAAAACLGLPPGACLVLEDSPNGILAARAAGCPVVAVPNPVTSQLELPPPDLVVPSLAAQTLDELLAAVAASLAGRGGA